MGSFSFRTCKKWRSRVVSSEAAGKARTASNTMAHERHISAWRTRRPDTGNRNQSGGREGVREGDKRPDRRDVRKMEKLEK